MPEFMNKQTRNGFRIQPHLTSSMGFRACHGISLPSSASSLVIMIHFRQAAPGKRMKVASG